LHASVLRYSKLFGLVGQGYGYLFWFGLVVWLFGWNSATRTGRTSTEGNDLPTWGVKPQGVEDLG